jgi:hypothetical protein
LENPYKPPGSHVADAAELARGPRPQPVRRAIIAFWISWTLGLLTLLPGVREGVWDNPELPAGVTLVISIVLGAFSAWLIVMVGRGHNWARWTWVIFVALTYFLMAADPSGWERQGQLAFGVDVMTAVLELWGCYLILTGPGGAWFTRGARRSV